ncbi:AIPR family protein, partial [Candidatus Thiosymbion oneisti]
MKDQILKGYVDDFATAFELEGIEDSIVFEHFVNYCITSKQYPREFDFDILRVGGMDDNGFDGAAFIVNGNIVKAPEEVGYLLKNNGYLDVSFIFIQTKKSAHFKGDQVGTLIFGIKSFFDDKPAIPENDDIQNLRRIKEEVYRNSIGFQSSPTLNLYFVTTGEWKEPAQITGRVEKELRDLESKKLFSSVEFNYYDADKLKQAYREINRKTVKEVSFHNHVALPEIPGVRQSFVGSISAKEYVRLISDNENNLQKYLFEDNVRDYQGYNKVNREIERTIKNSKEQAALSVFNNGITIIAKKVEPIGNKMKLTDFQIVNGCQSSHVLFENKLSLLEDTHVVIKVIETTDYDFATRVVKATNRQTEVKDEAFESLSQFHKDLEDYYKAKAKTVPDPIYYERRSKQYDGSPTVKTGQVIS